MIHRLSMPAGIPLPHEANNFEQALGELLIAHMPGVVTLDPGVYDVTPKVWTKHTHNHEVTVLDNGEGLYRITPRYAGSGYTLSPSQEFRRGGKVQPINAEQPLAVLAGGYPHKRELQVFELFAYVTQPEPMPEPEITDSKRKRLFSWFRVLQRV